ncbi:hypothetical protein [Spirosoma areae]
METTLTIPKNPVYPPSMDFSRLRREGIRHIERMGSAIWTDYNTHDPGITILEVLCYALTDLGYRANLPPSDLFAADPDEPNRKPYFTAAEILPNEPVTARDLRKILIDLPGIHNAWVASWQEPEVLVRLTTTLTVGDEEKTLYKTFVSQADATLQALLVADLPAFKLDTLTITVRETTDSPDELIPLTEVLLRWYKNQRDCKPTLVKLYGNAFFEGLIRQLFKPLITPTKEQEKAFKKALATVGEQPAIRDLIGRLLLGSLETFKPPKDEDGNPATPNYSLYIPQGIYQIYLLLDDDCDESEITQAALAQLHAHRNLGEDFYPEFSIVERQPIAICANIEIATDAHADEVLPLIYETIGEYLSPTLRFYTLQEMMDKNGVFYLSDSSLERLTDAQLPVADQLALTPLLGTEFAGRSAFMNALRLAVGTDSFADYEALLFYHAEKRYDSHPVYQGPLLTHGFLDDAELEAAQLRQTIYKSDLYQLILTVPGVVSIENLVLDKCYHEEGVDGRRGMQHDNWCLSCGCNCLPQLDVDCSTFSFTKGIGYVQPDVQMARERYELLRMKHTAVDRQGSLDLTPPTGHFRPDLTDFTSVQEDFPVTYHVGREGIARTESPQRQAQAKQLKAYLLFYDQLLANYLAHLAEVRNLLAIDNDPGKTPNRLHQLPNVPGLLTLLQNGNATAYETDLTGLVSGSAVEQQLTRNRLLNHLMARFGEQFTDYALQYYPIERPAEYSPYGDLSQWIGQKQIFLQYLPGLGSHRGRGFNYRAQPQADNLHVWNSPNVAGLKRRVCALLGMPQSNLERMPFPDETDPLTTFRLDWTRHPISTEPNFFVETFAQTTGSRRRYRFGLKSSPDEADNLLVSTALYAKRTSADEAGQAFFDRAADPVRYGIRQLPTKQWEVGFWETKTDDTIPDEEPLLASPLPFLYEQRAKEELERIRKLAVAQDQDDSFHIVEHILLRPRDEEYIRLELAQPSSVPPLARLDPYSFQLTVVVPYWVKRFNDPRLFSQFEQMLRLETPAHLMLCICRYDRAQMFEFETKYLDWLLVNTQFDPEPFALREATNALIEVLNQYRSTCNLPQTADLTPPDCLPPTKPTPEP